MAFTVQTPSTCCILYHLFDHFVVDADISLFQHGIVCKTWSFVSLVLDSSLRTCYFLRSLHIETGLFPTQPK